VSLFQRSGVIGAIRKRLATWDAPTPQNNGQAYGSDWYDRAYTAIETYHVAYEKSPYYSIWTVIVDRIRQNGLRRVLEIGCGPGQLAALLLDQGVEHYTGLDFSPVAISIARNTVPRGRFVVDDACTSTLYVDIEYDVIVCTEVLEHIDDDLSVVTHFRPGVRCLCTVPNFPYESHVRHFRDVDEVVRRYSAFFDDFDVATIKGPQTEGQMYFLFEGVRNEYRL